MQIKVEVECDEESLICIPADGEDEEEQVLHIALAAPATQAEVDALCEAMEGITMTCEFKYAHSSAPTRDLVVDSLFNKLAEHDSAHQALRPGAVLVRRLGGEGLMEMEIYLRGGNRAPGPYYGGPPHQPQGGNGARVLGIVTNHYDHWLQPNICPGDEYECEVGQCVDCERGDSAEVTFINVDILDEEEEEEEEDDD